MMTVKEFLREKLTHLAEAFPYITIKYSYDELAEAHLIKLSPAEKYYNNTKLEEAWFTLIGNFIKQFSGEGIYFISTDSTSRIENPEFVFNHENYQVLSQKIEYLNNLQIKIVKDFIRERLVKIAEAFPHISIKYNYDKLAESHIVELAPVDEYYNNTQLDEAWFSLTKDFWDQFPGEDICFISTDATFLRVEKPEFAFNQESNLLITTQD